MCCGKRVRQTASYSPGLQENLLHLVQGSAWQSSTRDCPGERRTSENCLISKDILFKPREQPIPVHGRSNQRGRGPVRVNLGLLMELKCESVHMVEEGPRYSGGTRGQLWWWNRTQRTRWITITIASCSCEKLIWFQKTICNHHWKHTVFNLINQQNEAPQKRTAETRLVHIPVCLCVLSFLFISSTYDHWKLPSFSVHSAHPAHDQLKC